MDSVTSLTSQSATLAKPQAVEAEQVTQTSQTTTTTTAQQPAVVVDLSPEALAALKLQNSQPESQTVLKLEDLSSEEQQRLLKMRENIRQSLALNGRAMTKGMSFIDKDGNAKVLTLDGRIMDGGPRIGKPTPLSAEELAQRKAADEQKKYESQFRQAARKEFEAKWGAGQPVFTGPMTKAETAAAEDVARTELMLASVRDNITTLHRLNHEIQRKAQALPNAVAKSSDGGAQANSDFTAYVAQRQKDIAHLEASLAEVQNDFRQYGYQVEGNLVEKQADGSYREGSYSLSKTTGAWAVKVSSDQGIAVSMGGQPFTRDFKRVVAARIGAWMNPVTIPPMPTAAPDGVQA